MPDTYYNRGVAYRVKGDHDRAIADYTKAVALNPNNAEAYYNHWKEVVTPERYAKKPDLTERLPKT